MRFLILGYWNRSFLCLELLKLLERRWTWLEFRYSSDVVVVVIIGIILIYLWWNWISPIRKNNYFLLEWCVFIGFIAFFLFFVGSFLNLFWVKNLINPWDNAWVVKPRIVFHKGLHPIEMEKDVELVWFKVRIEHIVPNILLLRLALLIHYQHLKFLENIFILVLLSKVVLLAFEVILIKLRWCKLSLVNFTAPWCCILLPEHRFVSKWKKKNN